MIIPPLQVGLYVLSAVTGKIYIDIKNSLRKGAMGPLPISSIYEAINHIDQLRFFKLFNT
jgi:hypothetical protein